MSSTELFIAILIVAIIASLLYIALPKEYAIKSMLIYYAFNKNTQKYDFDKTLKNHQKYTLIMLAYSTIILFLSQIRGQEVQNLAVWIFFGLAFIGSFCMNPVKNKGE